MATLVLSVGQDSALLAIRRLMLAEAGFSVVNAVGNREFVDRLFDTDFDVIVLCSSLAPVERQRMAALVRHHRPSASIYALTALSDGACDAADSSICGDTADLLRALSLPDLRNPHTNGHAA